MTQDELTYVSPSHEFYAVDIVIEGIDPETGKDKKFKEQLLVDGKNATEVEEKVIATMRGDMRGETKITGMKVSKVTTVVY